MKRTASLRTSPLVFIGEVAAELAAEEEEEECGEPGVPSTDSDNIGADFCNGKSYRISIAGRDSIGANFCNRKSYRIRIMGRDNKGRISAT